MKKGINESAGKVLGKEKESQRNSLMKNIK
jgi:hypothetical protein